MGWMLRIRMAHPAELASGRLGVVDLRSARFPGASVPSHRHQDLLSGFEGPSQARSLTFLVGTWSARAREPGL